MITYFQIKILMSIHKMMIVLFVTTDSSKMKAFLKLEVEEPTTSSLSVFEKNN